MTNLTVPKKILAQLGGEGFVGRSGAIDLLGSADSLIIKLGRNTKHVTQVRITATPDGLYDVTFFTIGKGPQSYDGIPSEMLQQVFGAHLALSTPRSCPY